MSTLLGTIIADFETQLASKIVVGGTSLTLATATDDDGVALPAGRYFFTIDGDNSLKEHIAATLSGTALTAIKTVSRQGVETSGVLRAHRIGASIKITDFGHLDAMKDLLAGTVGFNASTPLKYDGATTPTLGQYNLPDWDYVKAYADGIAVAGAPDASLTTKGLVEIATTAEIDAGTGTGSTGAQVAMTPDQFASSIYNTRLPSADQKAAMAGGSTFGTPSASNKFITQDYNSSATGLPVVRVYTANTPAGSSTTQFDITNPSGTTFRYTFDGTGTDPSFSAVNYPIGTIVDLQAQNFAAGNKGLFAVTGSGANYIEVTNASGVVESNKTIGTGYIVKGAVWTKPAGLKYIKIKQVGAGAAGEGVTGSDTAGSGGASAGYAEKLIATAALASTVNYVVGYKAVGTNAASTSVAGRTVFNHSTPIITTGGTGQTSPGTATGGDLNVAGQQGAFPSTNSTSANRGAEGADSILGLGGPGGWGGSENGKAATGYGASGGGACTEGATDGNGGDGASGVIIIEEYYS